MAGTFDRQFRKAYDDVVKLEQERARFMKSQGWNTYRDMERQEQNPEVLYGAAADCERSAAAYEKLAKFARHMSEVFENQSSKLVDAAIELE